MTQKAFPKPVGIKDVAQCAGVSISTVSNALSGKKPVSSQLKKRVMDAVCQLEYEANPIGRQLKTGRSQQIAFLVPSITSIFFPDVLKSMQSAADAAGYTVSVFGTKGDVARERRIINLLRSQGFDGVFLDSCADVDKPETAEYLDFLHAVNFDKDAPMRIICVETAISPKLDAVVINDADGIALMTEYLIRSGCRRFAHIAAPNQYFHAKNRRKGFLTALMLNGIPADQAVIAEGNFTCRSGYNAMVEILDSGKTVDAVVCGNDQMAIGALYCLKERGIRVPEDIAVAGFNDNVPASLVTPSLTTMRVPKAEMGSCAFDLFQRRNGGDESARIQIQLACELIVRQSTDANVQTAWELDW